MKIILFGQFFKLPDLGAYGTLSLERLAFEQTCIQTDKQPDRVKNKGVRTNIHPDRQTAEQTELTNYYIDK